ncbi:hypothetical protein AB0M23_24515 [Streptomyces sp. NPDC052077]|uniref:hypothetical protein n=1 Tax=Streptomyces sp. NPDC052077 TaxID=3154757 RepID=UPI003439EA52
MSDQPYGQQHHPQQGYDAGAWPGHRPYEDSDTGRHTQQWQGQTWETGLQPPVPASPAEETSLLPQPPQAHPGGQGYPPDPYAARQPHPHGPHAAGPAPYAADPRSHGSRPPQPYGSPEPQAQPYGTPEPQAQPYAASQSYAADPRSYAQPYATDHGARPQPPADPSHGTGVHAGRSPGKHRAQPYGEAQAQPYGEVHPQSHGQAMPAPQAQSHGQAQPQPYAQPQPEPYAQPYAEQPRHAVPQSQQYAESQSHAAPQPHAASAPAPAAPGAVPEAGPAEGPADGPEYGPATLAGNARVTDAQRARAEGRSPIIDPGMQPALLTAVLGLLLAGAAAVGTYALLVPLVALQGLTAAGWFRLNGMWPARQGIALGFAGALAADAAMLASDRSPAALIGTLGVWVLLSLVLQLRSHADPDERMYGLMATVAATALAVVAGGYLAADHEAVTVGAVAVAVALVVRALPVPAAVSTVGALIAAAVAGGAVGSLTMSGPAGALLGAGAAVCALAGHRAAAYDYPSRFVHFTAGVALPLAAAAPAIHLLGRVLG